MTCIQNLSNLKISDTNLILRPFKTGNWAHTVYRYCMTVLCKSATANCS